MIPYERQKKLLDIIKAKELVKIDELQDSFKNISNSTLRRDLKELEKERKIELLSGGAVKISTTKGEIPISKRSTLYSAEKEKIAKLAADLIEDGDTIYLDSGSTAAMLFKNILDKKITIYTSNPDVITVRDKISAEIIVIGGKYSSTNSSLYGALTENILKQLYFNKAFIGANGVDEKFGVMTPSMEEANKKRLVKEHSDSSYLICDSSKFHNLSNVKAFDLKDITIISDKDDEIINQYAKIIY